MTEILTKMLSLVKTWGCCPHSDRLEKLTLLREGFVQIRRELTEILTKTLSFSQNMGLLPPHSDHLEKLTLPREGFVQIRRELTEILTKMLSFSQNIGLLPLIPIVSKS